MRLVAFFIILFLGACATTNRKDNSVPVLLPFMRMDADECYFLDDFMPTPDRMVTGRSAGVYLRYYTFEKATYKSWLEDPIMLAFYSRDSRCWSLFEEHDLPKPGGLF